MYSQRAETDRGRLSTTLQDLKLSCSLVPRPFINYERPGYEARNYEVNMHPYPQIPSHPHTLTSSHPHTLTVSTAAPGDEGVSEDTRPLHQQTGPSAPHHWRLHHPTLPQPLPQQTRLVRQPLPPRGESCNTSGSIRQVTLQYQNFTASFLLYDRLFSIGNQSVTRY